MIRSYNKKLTPWVCHKDDNFKELCLLSSHDSNSIPVSSLIIYSNPPCYEFLLSLLKTGPSTLREVSIQKWQRCSLSPFTNWKSLLMSKWRLSVLETKTTKALRCVVCEHEWQIDVTSKNSGVFVFQRAVSNDWKLFMLLRRFQLLYWVVLKYTRKISEFSGELVFGLAINMSF